MKKRGAWRNRYVLLQDVELDNGHPKFAGNFLDGEDTYQSEAAARAAAKECLSKNRGKLSYLGPYYDDGDLIAQREVTP